MTQSIPIRIARLVHPFPSFVNAGLVFGLGLLAGAAPARAALLAVGMLGLQFCIGAVNDVADEQLDSRAKPWKPVPSGLVSRSGAAIVALTTGGGGLAASALAGPVPLLLALGMLGAGMAYDLFLKPTAWAWLCFAIAFPMLPIYAWFGAVGTLPPRPELLLPLAALAAPALQLSNGLVDLEADRAGGIATLATRLGRRRAVALMAVVLAVLHATAWLTLSQNSLATVATLVGASGLSIAGVFLSYAVAARLRQLGWAAQALSLALLALGWLSAAV